MDMMPLSADLPKDSDTSDIETSIQLKRTDYIEWVEYFMAVSLLAAKRSKDPTCQVGACVVSPGNTIVGIGYNGMPNHCHDDEFPWGKNTLSPLDSKYLYVCHAEMNAIINKNCVDLRDCTIYVTLFPCNECAKMIIQSRIRCVIYLSDKHDERPSTLAAKRMFQAANVEYRKYDGKSTHIILEFTDATR